MDIKDIIANHTNENGEVNYEEINASISENMVSKEEVENKYISKEEAIKQNQAVAKKYKEKYKKTDDDNTSENENKTPSQNVDELVNSAVSKKLEELGKQTEKEKEINEKLENVSEDFQELIKFKLEKDSNFDVEGYLKSNPNARKKSIQVGTDNFQTNKQSNSHKVLSPRQQKLYEVLYKN